VTGGVATGEFMMGGVAESTVGLTR